VSIEEYSPNRCTALTVAEVRLVAGVDFDPAAVRQTTDRLDVGGGERN
jgi:hypothetical protein